VLVAPMMLFTDLVAVYQVLAEVGPEDVLALAPPCLVGAMGGVLLLNWFTQDVARRAIGFIGLVYVGTELLKDRAARFTVLARPVEKHSDRSGCRGCLGIVQLGRPFSLDLYCRAPEEEHFVEPWFLSSWD